MLKMHLCDENLSLWRKFSNEMKSIWWKLIDVIKNHYWDEINHRVENYHFDENKPMWQEIIDMITSVMKTYHCGEKLLLW